MHEIKDITKRDAGDFYRFSIVCNDGVFFIHMSKKDWREKWGEHISIGDIPLKRIAQLANEILTFLNKEAKVQEWKPTMYEFEQKIREIHGNNHGIEHWFIDWLRLAVSMERKNELEQAVRIYEWMKSNEKWLYEGLKKVRHNKET